MILSYPQRTFNPEKEKQTNKKRNTFFYKLGFPGGSADKESACDAGDLGLIPGLGSHPLEKGMATHSSILAWRIP